ncbi:MAG: hypothetical protein Gaeavirus1_24 [Gaeavirus sp.]|uniref:Uncharacterized protein n=1 Tax=Gaeavirus sp. TaxID=2487767 RepID=A0A3G4ZY93_9VIRU|nr:MAG: hypothetical protein Gaeavirus1_24 [Gaeavirus sp.]
MFTTGSKPIGNINNNVSFTPSTQLILPKSATVDLSYPIPTIREYTQQDCTKNCEIKYDSYKEHGQMSCALSMISGDPEMACKIIHTNANKDHCIQDCKKSIPNMF